METKYLVLKVDSTTNTEKQSSEVTKQPQAAETILMVLKSLPILVIHCQFCEFHSISSTMLFSTDKYGVNYKYCYLLGVTFLSKHSVRCPTRIKKKEKK